MIDMLVRTGKLISLLMTMVVIANIAFPQQSTFERSALTVNGQRAFDELRGIKLFAVGGIGYGGETSQGELALDVLIEEKSSAKAFKELIRDGTTEGAMYGLFGLRMLGCDCFNKEFTKLKAIHFSGAKVQKFTFQSGCALMQTESPKDKTFLLNWLMEKWFEKIAAFKERDRKQKGQENRLPRVIKDRP